MHLYLDTGATGATVLAYLNHMSDGTPFAVVNLGKNARMHLHSADDCDALIAAAAEAKRLLSPPAEPARSHVCECGHYEAYHVGAVRGDDNPGQCTACVTCDTFEAMTATAPAPEAGQ